MPPTDKAGQTAGASRPEAGQSAAPNFFGKLDKSGRLIVSEFEVMVGELREYSLPHPQIVGMQEVFLVMTDTEEGGDFFLHIRKNSKLGDKVIKLFDHDYPEDNLWIVETTTELFSLDNPCMTITDVRRF